MIDLEEIHKLRTGLIFVSDGSSGSERILKILVALPKLLNELEEYQDRIRRVQNYLHSSELFGDPVDSDDIRLLLGIS